MKQKKINIVIADDNRFFCEALKDSLNNNLNFNVLETFTELSELIKYNQSFSYDVLILDINFNGISSLESINDLKSYNKTLKTLALTTLNNDFIREKAYKNGVDVFIGKDEDFSSFNNKVLECFNNHGKNDWVKSSKFFIDDKIITKHKLNILQAMYSNSDKNEKELAKILSISVSSLKTHKRELFEITNTKSTPELLKYGIQKGLIIA